MDKKDTTKKEAETKVVTTTVLKHPRITEKAAKAAQTNTYLFSVAVGATKNEIAKAFAAQYKHKPTRVNIVNVKPKVYRRRGKLGVGSRLKKAYVTLPKGTTIEIM